MRCKWLRSKKEENTRAGRKRRTQNKASRRAARLNRTCPSCKGSEYGDHSTPCYLCLSPAQATDHLIPLSRGGFHCNTNFRPVCKACNTAKGNRTYPGQYDWDNFKLSRRQQ